MATFYAITRGSYLSGNLVSTFGSSIVTDGEGDNTFETGDFYNGDIAYRGTATYNGVVLPVFETLAGVFTFFSPVSGFSFPAHFSDFSNFFLNTRCKRLGFRNQGSQHGDLSKVRIA